MKAAPRQKSGLISSGGGEAFDWKMLALGLVGIVLVTFISYLPALRAGFIWDDDVLLTDNALVTGPDGLRLIWFSTGFVDFIPLTLTSYWLEFRLWGLNPTGYHAVNIMLHVLSGVLFWRVLSRLRVPAAFFAALLFVVHPVNVESVAWVAQRKNTLSLFFYALSLLLFLRSDEGQASPARKSRGHPTACYWLALASFALSLLSKPAGITLPVVLLLMLAWRHGRIARKDIRRTAPFFLLALVMAAVAVWTQHRQGTAGEPAPGIFTRMAGAGWVAWFYAFKAWLPLNLCFAYPRWPINPREWLAWGPNVAWIFCFALFWRFRQGWGKPFLFAAGYYLLTLFPVIGFFHIYYFRYSLVADHYQYFSIVAVVALFAALFETLSRNWLRLWRRLAQSSLVLLLCLLTWLQARIYFNPETLWTDTLAKNPNSWQAHDQLGYFLGEQKRYDEAIRHFAATLTLRPHERASYLNWALALMCLNQPDEAMAKLETALQIDPDYIEAHTVLGNLLIQRGRNAEAARHHISAHRLAAAQFLKQGKTAPAVAHWREALKLSPDSSEFLNNLAWSLATNPNPEFRNGAEAVQLAQRACPAGGAPDPHLLDTLAAAYAEAGRFPEAVAALEQAIGLADSAGEAALAGQFRLRLSLYRRQRPYHESSPR